MPRGDLRPAKHSGREVSRQVFEIFRDLTPLVEGLSTRLTWT